VGEVTAGRIVAYRSAHPFVSVVGFFGISRMPPARRIE
jgi:hypothetical protein